MTYLLQFCFNFAFIFNFRCYIEEDLIDLDDVVILRLALYLRAHLHFAARRGP